MAYLNLLISIPNNTYMLGHCEIRTATIHSFTLIYPLERFKNFFFLADTHTKEKCCGIKIVVHVS